MADLPRFIYWRVGEVVLVSLPQRERRAGRLLRIPVGAEAWKLPTDKAWRELDTVPQEYRTESCGP